MKWTRYRNMFEKNNANTRCHCISLSFEIMLEAIPNQNESTKFKNKIKRTNYYYFSSIFI